jgi:hypothetical protein
MDKTDILNRQYQALRKAQLDYLERKRQAKKDAGTYRPRGRPRKNAESKQEIKQEKVHSPNLISFLF